MTLEGNFFILWHNSRMFRDYEKKVVIYIVNLYWVPQIDDAQYGY